MDKISIIKVDIPELSSDAEGKLKGGFASLSPNIVNPMGEENPSCTVNKIICINGKCSKPEPEPEPTPIPTPTPTPTPAPEEAVSIGFMGSTLLF